MYSRQNNKMRAQQRLPGNAAQQGLRGTQHGFQMSTARLWENCSTAGAAKGVDLTVEKYDYWILGVNNEIWKNTSENFMRVRPLGRFFQEGANFNYFDSLIRVIEMTSHFAEMLKACGGVEVVESKIIFPKTKNGCLSSSTEPTKLWLRGSPISVQGKNYFHLSHE